MTYLNQYILRLHQTNEHFFEKVSVGLLTQS